MILIVFLTMFIINSGEVSASLHANPNTQYTKKGYPGQEWIRLFRTMEQAGETMGLNETLNADYTPQESNNIDVHLIKTTEYGAMAILTASAYGNENTGIIKTTTGNDTGVILSSTDYEYAAGCGNAAVVANGSVNIDTRYYLNYADGLSKVGDALECINWHGGTAQMLQPGRGYYFVRGGSGIFGYAQDNFYNPYGAFNSYCSRGAVVCGAGF